MTDHAIDVRYISGLESIDHAHNEIDQFIFAIEKSLAQADRLETSKALFDQLFDLVAQHFREEEEHMEQTAYPGIAAHRKSHDDFLTNLHGIIANRGFCDQIALESIDALQQWLSVHVFEADQPFADFVLKRNQEELS